MIASRFSCYDSAVELNLSIRFENFDTALHGDLVDSLTTLLHEAYAPLAAQGMKYLATHQPSSKTRERLLEGESYLAFLGGDLAGTITLYREKMQSTCDYYRQAGIFSFGQFAIRHDLKGRGLGSKMMDLVEARAKKLGAKELALDTSEHASELIAMYEKRGYKHVAFTKWEVTNYRSVIMSKPLA